MHYWLQNVVCIYQIIIKKNYSSIIAHDTRKDIQWVTGDPLQEW